MSFVSCPSTDNLCSGICCSSERVTRCLGAGTRTDQSVSREARGENETQTIDDLQKLNFLWLYVADETDTMTTTTTADNEEHSE